MRTVVKASSLIKFTLKNAAADISEMLITLQFRQGGLLGSVHVIDNQQKILIHINNGACSCGYKSNPLTICHF
jgi:hypothetical protein